MALFTRYWPKRHSIAGRWRLAADPRFYLTRYDEWEDAQEQRRIAVCCYDMLREGFSNAEIDQAEQELAQSGLAAARFQTRRDAQHALMHALGAGMFA